MSDTPTPTSTLTDTQSFPEVPNGGLELGDLASSFAHATLGPFEVHDVIGRGGMGIVFSGEHLGQQVPVAIKVITRKGAEHPRLREAMHNEVRAVAGLEHPGIVRVLDFGDISENAEVLTEGALRAGTPYFVMEMMAHSSLVEIVGRVSWRQAKTILLNLLDALAHSHARDVIHRDIKPGNVLLDQWGGRVVPKLADFGLAFASGMPTDVSRSIGTPQYMAPEQIETPWRKHGPWSDLYSVGCLAFELLSGRKLFAGRSIVEIFRLHLDAARKPLRSIVRVPDGFQDWLYRMVERNAQDRFRSAADAARALLVLDDSSVPDVRPPDCCEHNFARLSPVLNAVFDAPKVQQELSWPKRYPASMRLVGAGLGLYGLRQIPLAGRREELSQLWSTFHEASTEGVRVVVLHGAHGTGKTKLVNAFTQRLIELGSAVSMNASHSSTGSPEDGVPMMIARWLRAAGATRAEAGGILRDAMADSAERFEWESTLALIQPALAGVDTETKYAFEFTSNAQRHDVGIRKIRKASADAPVVVTFDDVHHSIDSLEFVAQLCTEAPLTHAFVVLTVCDDELADLPESAALLERIVEHGAEQIELGRLNRVEHMNFVGELLMLSGDLAIQVGDRTDGNPGFAVDLIDQWVKQGDLQVGETGFVLSAGTELLDHVPNSARDLWIGSLGSLVATLTEEDLKSMELAAALGTAVWRDEWETVCSAIGVEPSWASVGALLDRRLVSTTPAGWRFEHPVVSDFFRETAQNAGRWTRWKFTCAEELQRGGETTEKLERIGMYWLDAEEFSLALDPLRRSAKAHQQRGDYREADRIATGMARAIERGEGGDRELADVHMFRTLVYAGANHPDEALRWARKALELAEGHDWPDLTAKATGYVALSKQWLGEPDAGEWLDRALDMLAGKGPSFKSDGVVMVIGYLLTSLGRFADAQRVLELDRQIAAAADDANALASNAYQRCRTAIYLRDFDEAEACGLEAKRHFEELGRIPALAAVVGMLAEVHRLREDFEQAAAMYRESIELMESLGDKAFVSKASLGNVLLAKGKFGEAEELFLEAATEAAVAGRRRCEVVCKAGLLVCAAKQGHWSSATRLVPAIQEFVSSTKETEIDLADLLEAAGDEFALAGRVDEAETIWQIAQAQWNTLDDQDRARGVAEKLDRLRGEA